MRKNAAAETLLMIKVDEIKTAADAYVQVIQDWQIIKDHLSNKIDVSLTEDQERKMVRYMHIHNQLLTGRYSKVEVIKQTMRIYKISQKQAYEDYNCTTEIFSSLVPVNKLFELQLEIEVNKRLRMKAEEVMDFKGAAACGKNLIALIAQLPEKEEFDAKDFSGHNVEASDDPRLLGAPDVDMKAVLAAINEKRKVKIKTELFETAEVIKEDVDN